MLCAALITFACWILWLYVRAAAPIKVAITYLGTTTNTSSTFTTSDGTFPVTAATFRVSNVGKSRVVQWGDYYCDAKGDSLPAETGFYTWAPELSGVLAPGQSKTVSISTPWPLHGPWRAVFLFSRYSWRHKFQELSPRKEDMVLRFVPERWRMATENWLTATPSETVASPWIDVGGGGQSQPLWTPAEPQMSKTGHLDSPSPRRRQH